MKDYEILRHLTYQIGLIYEKAVFREKVIVIGKNGLYCHYMILHRLENTSVYIGRKMSHFLRRQRRLILQYIMQVLFG